MGKAIRPPRLKGRSNWVPSKKAPATFTSGKRRGCSSKALKASPVPKEWATSRFRRYRTTV